MLTILQNLLVMQEGAVKAKEVYGKDIFGMLIFTLFILVKLLFLSSYTILSPAFFFCRPSDEYLYQDYD